VYWKYIKATNNKDKQMKVLRLLLNNKKRDNMILLRSLMQWKLYTRLESNFYVSKIKMKERKSKIFGQSPDILDENIGDSD
jgi:hypothetical protein